MMMIIIVTMGVFVCHGFVCVFMGVPLDQQQHGTDDEQRRRHSV
jgi:hypothetical protein